MSRHHPSRLRERVIAAAQAALERAHTVSAVDAFLGTGWLDPNMQRAWRQGRAACLEDVVQARLSHLTEALDYLTEWAEARGLEAREGTYVASTPQRPPLRFTATGDEAQERRFRTHWTSPTLGAKARERVDAAANKGPERVVIQPLEDDWTCHRCGGTGDLLMMDTPGPCCLPCAGLGELVFLPSGDAGRSRRAKARCAVYAVVVRFSRARKRYERLGLMVEPAALAGEGDAQA